MHSPGILVCSGLREATRFLHPSHGRWDVGLILDDPDVSVISAGYLHCPITLVCPGPFARTLLIQASQVMRKAIVGYDATSLRRVSSEDLSLRIVSLIPSAIFMHSWRGHSWAIIDKFFPFP